MKKILTIIGARPQIIKASAISRAIKNSFAAELSEVIVHTGQHYDTSMSEIFFKEMHIPEPNYNLQVGSGSHGKQTAKMLDLIEQLILKDKPDAILVYGDTNSTLAGALAASKLHVPVIHVEAGLRSFNKCMPEEINRILTDHVSTMLFCPSKQGLENLEKEGFIIENNGKTFDQPSIYHCGDIMYDNSLHFSEIADEKILETYNLIPNEYVLCTIHRDNNTDQHDRLQAIMEALEIISEERKMKIIWPIHPRTKNALINNLDNEEQKAIFASEKVKIIEPVGFFDMISLEKNARLIITDSGGVQKEAYFFNKPGIILRSETEWVEIVESGKAVITDADTQKIVDVFDDFMSKPAEIYPKLFGDGKAAEFICAKILECL